jgi:DNA topoisomerase-3
VFLDELKAMVNQVVINVLSDQSGRGITIEEKKEEKAKNTTKPKADKESKPAKERKPRAKKQVKAKCPICGKGDILRGKTAYGCSEYKNGCTFRLDYATYGEGLTEEQLVDIISGLGK